MRILLAAVVLLGLELWFQLEAGTLAEFYQRVRAGQPQSTKDALVIIVAALLLIEGLWRIFGREQDVEKTDQPKAPQGPSAEEWEELQAKLGRSEQEKDKLQTAYREAELRLDEAKSEALLRARPEAVNAEIINLLSMFQEQGRFIDFLMEDIATYSDAQVGAAARVVHQGCAKVLKDYFKIVPVHTGNEGDRLTLQDFSPRQYRLLGTVQGEPPFSGKVLHRGWRATEVRLPRVQQNDGTDIIAPTEVQL